MDQTDKDFLDIVLNLVIYLAVFGIFFLKIMDIPWAFFIVAALPIALVYYYSKHKQLDKKQAEAKPLTDEEVAKKPLMAKIYNSKIDDIIDGPHGPAPYGGIIWDDEYTIDELIFKNGKYYINENSEEWEENE